MRIMATVNIHEAKTHLSRLLVRAAAGEQIVIARAGVPLAMLVPIDRPRPRAPGNDRIVVRSDFDDPLPEWDADYMHPDDPLRETPR